MPTPSSVWTPETGAVVWQTQVGPSGALGGTPWGSASDGRRIYVAIANFYGIPYEIASADGQKTTTNSGSWAALDPATGRILWQVADPQQAGDLGYVSSANGVMYAGSTAASGATMFALDAASGRILWDFASGSPVISGAAIAAGHVYWGLGVRVWDRHGLPGRRRPAEGLQELRRCAVCVQAAQGLTRQ
jgi:polyvinyl alcohol dehydrogenase (cytochrome)